MFLILIQKQCLLLWYYPYRNLEFPLRMGFILHSAWCLRHKTLSTSNDINFTFLLISLSKLGNLKLASQGPHHKAYIYTTAVLVVCRKYRNTYLVIIKKSTDVRCSPRREGRPMAGRRNLRRYLTDNSLGYRSRGCKLIIQITELQ